MSDRNAPIVESLRAVGFMLAVVFGGLLIAAVIGTVVDRSGETDNGAGPAAEQAPAGPESGND